jgi:hypothetical protein
MNLTNHVPPYQPEHQPRKPGPSTYAGLRWAAAKTLVQAGHVTLLVTLHLGGDG